MKGIGGLEEERQKEDLHGSEKDIGNRRRYA